MKNIKTNNNISLHYIEMKKLKTTVCGMYIKRKLKSDSASMNATLSYVLKNGCKKFPTLTEINRELQSLYGATLNSGVIKNGDNHVIFFDAETISDKYAPNGENLVLGLVEMLMNVVFCPYVVDGGFDKEIVKREKNTVINRINSLINDKRSYAQLRCTQELCENDSFSISKFGEIEDVEKIDEKSLYEYYKSIITSSQIDIFVAGECDCTQITELVDDFLKDLSFSEPCEIINKKIQFKSDKKNVEEKMEVTQGKLSIGFVTDINAKDPQYPALVVANSIYGAGTHSKLFNNVREKLSLAYYASSGLNKYKGILLVNAGIECENFKKAYDEAILQLDELKKGNITSEELEFSKKTIINNLDAYYDDQRYMQLYCLDCIYLGITPNLEDYKEKIKSVTKEDVIKVSQNIKETVVYFLTKNK